MSPRRAQVSARTALQLEPATRLMLDELARLQKKPMAMVVREILDAGLPKYRQDVFKQLADRQEAAVAGVA